MESIKFKAKKKDPKKVKVTFTTRRGSKPSFKAKWKDPEKIKVDFYKNKQHAKKIVEKDFNQLPLKEQLEIIVEQMNKNHELLTELLDHILINLEEEEP